MLLVFHNQDALRAGHGRMPQAEAGGGREKQRERASVAGARALGKRPAAMASAQPSGR